MENVDKILERIDELIDTPFVTPRFGNNWKQYAKENFDVDWIIDIAWWQARKAILLEEALRKIIEES